MSHYNGCGCGGHKHNSCNSCTSHNEIQQAVNDALALEKENLEQYENNAAQSALDAANEAAKAAESASAAAQSQTNAETAAGTATQAASSVTDTAAVLEETAERIEQAQDLLEEQISAIQTKPVYFEVSTPTNTLVLPESETVFNVRSIYVASARKDVGYGFTFDKATRTITLADGITADDIAESGAGFILVTAICDVYSSDDPTSFPLILASNVGANNVGTSTGDTVETRLENVDEAIAAISAPTGLNTVGSVLSFNALRAIVPELAGQIINLRSYQEGWAAQAHQPVGGGRFVAIAGTAVDDGGYICVPTGQSAYYWQRIIEDETLHAEHYGARCDSTRLVAGTDCADALNRMFATAIANNFAVEFSSKAFNSDTLERGYYISKTVVATGVKVIKGNPVFHVKSSVFDQTTSKYALLLGDPNTDFSTILNGLIFSTISVRDLDKRAGNMCGIYVKYTAAYGTFLRAIDINGVGIELAPVYDSLFIPIVERCGNVNEYSLWTNPNGDECNAITFPYILCHDSYHKGMYVVGSKIVINNIHAEANAVLTTDDGYTGLTGSTTSTGLKYVNHVIYLTDGHLGNASFNDYAYANGKTYYGDQNTLNGSAGSHVAIALVESTCGNVNNKISTSRGGNKARTSFFSANTWSMIDLITAGYVYFEGTSRLAVNMADINTIFSWSAYTEIRGGRVLNWGSRFIGKLKDTRIDTALSADDSSYVDATRCNFPNGITHISASPLNKFKDCDIPTLSLTTANSAEVAEFNNSRIGATGGVTVANGTASYIKNLTFKGCTLRNAWSSDGVYSILRFVGTDNMPAGSAYSLTGWTRPRFTAPGTIVQQPKPAYTTGDVIQAVCLTLPSDGNATWQNTIVAA